MILKYDEHGQPYEDIALENKKLTQGHKFLKGRIKELENSLSIALEINDRHQREYRKLNEKARELGGKCREAGRVMIELNVKYEASLKELDRLKTKYEPSSNSC